MDASLKPDLGVYRRLERLGHGGQGTIWKAVCCVKDHPTVREGEIVAIKMLRADESNEKSQRAFVKQAQILESLSHPNVVRYRDSFTIGTTEWEELNCLVMEFLEGEDLSQVIAQRSACGDNLPWEEVREIFRQCLDGLMYAAGMGVVHRDIKPSNIFVTRDRKVKLIDFGVAHLTGGAGTTTGGGPHGTYDYMAPDFVRLSGSGFHGDERSDLFSLGICIYEALTGSLPFPPSLGSGPMAAIAYAKRWHDDAVAELKFRNRAFRVLNYSRSFLKSCLAVDREKRLDSFMAVSEAFRKVRRRVVRHKGVDEYELIEWIGCGGFGEVFKGHRLRDGKLVAVKRLMTERHSPKRFLREAAILGRLQNPHIVKYIDFVEIPMEDTEEREFFIILEYLDGMPDASLRKRVRDAPAGLPAKEVMELFSHYLEGLHQLHQAGVIHRDLKPNNLYAPAGRPEQAKIFDLGVARDEQGTVTGGRIPPGTFDYMAPEMADAGNRGSVASDLYALGLCFYEALTGAPAFSPLPHGEGDALREFLSRSKHRPRPDFDRAVLREFPPLCDVLKKALHPDPKRRYAAAEAMRLDIQAVLKTALATEPERSDTTAVSTQGGASTRGGDGTGGMSTGGGPVRGVGPSPTVPRTGTPATSATLPVDDTRDGTAGLVGRLRGQRRLGLLLRWAAVITVVGIVLYLAVGAVGSAGERYAQAAAAFETRALELTGPYVREMGDLHKRGRLLARIPWRSEAVMNAVDTISGQRRAVRLAIQSELDRTTNRVSVAGWSPLVDAWVALSSLTGANEDRLLLDRMVRALESSRFEDALAAIAARIPDHVTEFTLGAAEAGAAALEELRQTDFPGIPAEEKSRRLGALEDHLRSGFIGYLSSDNWRKASTDAALYARLADMKKQFPYLIRLAGETHKRLLDLAAFERAALQASNAIPDAVRADNIKLASGALNSVRALDTNTWGIGAQIPRERAAGLAALIGTRTERFLQEELVPACAKDETAYRTLRAFSNNVPELASLVWPVYAQCLADARKIRDQVSAQAQLDKFNEDASKVATTNELAMMLTRFVSLTPLARDLRRLDQVGGVAVEAANRVLKDLGREVETLYGSDRIPDGDRLAEAVLVVEAQTGEKLAALPSAALCRQQGAFGEWRDKAVRRKDEAEVNEFKAYADRVATTNDLAAVLTRFGTLAPLAGRINRLDDAGAATVKAANRVLKGLSLEVQALYDAQQIPEGDRRAAAALAVEAQAIKGISAWSSAGLQRYQGVFSQWRQEAERTKTAAEMARLEERQNVQLDDLKGLAAKVSTTNDLEAVLTRFGALVPIARKLNRLDDVGGAVVKAVNAVIKPLSLEVETLYVSDRVSDGDRVARAVLAVEAQVIEGLSPWPSTGLQRYQDRFSRWQKSALGRIRAKQDQLQAEEKQVAETVQALKGLGARAEAAASPSEVKGIIETAAERIAFLPAGRRADPAVGREHKAVGECATARLTALIGTREPVGKRQERLKEAQQVLKDGKLRGTPGVEAATLDDAMSKEMGVAVIRIENAAALPAGVAIGGQIRFVVPPATSTNWVGEANEDGRLAVTFSAAVPGYVEQRDEVVMSGGMGWVRRVGPFAIADVQVSIVRPAIPADTAPVELHYLPKGQTEWVEVKTDAMAMKPGEYEWRFRRTDFDPIQRVEKIPLGAATHVIRSPDLAQYQPGQALAGVREMQKLLKQGDSDALGVLLEKTEPALLQWPGHREQLKRLKDGWYEAVAGSLDRQLSKAEQSIDGLRAILYQVANPATGKRRLIEEKSALGKIPIELQSYSLRLLGSTNSLTARYRRAILWKDAASALGSEADRKKLAEELRALSSGPSPVARLAGLESRLLVAEPGAIPAAERGQTPLPEFYRWKAHAIFRSSQVDKDVLENLSAYVLAGGVPDGHDVTVAVYETGMILWHHVDCIKAAELDGHTVSADGRRVHDPALARKEAMRLRRSSAQSALAALQKILAPASAEASRQAVQNIQTLAANEVGYDGPMYATLAAGTLGTLPDVQETPMGELMAGAAPKETLREWTAVVAELARKEQK